MDSVQCERKTCCLSKAFILKAEKPVSSSAFSTSDCLVRELFLVTGSCGVSLGVPDGLYVFSVQGISKSSAPDSNLAVCSSSEDCITDESVIQFLSAVANFTLVHQRCSSVPGTMYSNTPKTSSKRSRAVTGWAMVDFIPLFMIINMESENERAQRLSRITREASAWDATMRDYRDKYKPKMSIPQTPSARSVASGASSTGGVFGGGPFRSCSGEETENGDANERVLPALRFTSETPVNCASGPKSVVSAARFFITFQHADEIKSETPSLLSLILIGHTESVPNYGSSSGLVMASARSMLDFELLLIRGVYANTVRNPEDTIYSEYEKDGCLSLHVHMPKWRIVAFVSPPSGKGEAIPTWTLAMLPVLYCGRLATLGILTTRRGHAEDVVADSLPGPNKKGHVFTNHDLLVSVGGDGVAHEICNGIARRNRYEDLPMQTHPHAPDAVRKKKETLTEQSKRDLEDPYQKLSRRHEEEIWADVPLEDPTGYFAVPDNVLSQTPYIGLVAAGSGCALAKEAEAENFIISALTLLHIKPFSLDCYRMDPFDVPESTLRASDARFMTTEAEKSAIKLRNSIEGSATFAKAAETPVRFGMLALMFAAVNEVDKGSEGMRWMGNTRFAVKTMAMLVTGVPLYRVYFRYSTDTFYMPEEKAPQINHQFGRSYSAGANTGCTDWVISPNFRVSFMSLNNIRLVARDICFAPYARPSDGFIDTLYVGAAEYDSSDVNYKLQVRRRDALDFFNKTETGAHVDDNACTYGKCRRVQILPIDGNVMADGEVMNKTGITVSCVRRGLILLASPSMKWEN